MFEKPPVIIHANINDILSLIPDDAEPTYKEQQKVVEQKQEPIIASTTIVEPIQNNSPIVSSTPSLKVETLVIPKKILVEATHKEENNNLKSADSTLILNFSAGNDIKWLK